MSWIVSLNKASRVPKVAADGESTASPEDFTLVTTEKTVPIATTHCRAVVFSFHRTGTPGGGDVANIYQRPSSEGAWVLMTSVDMSAGDGLPEQVQCPVGQLQVENIGCDTLEVFVEGLSAQF